MTRLLPCLGLACLLATPGCGPAPAPRVAPKVPIAAQVAAPPRPRIRYEVDVAPTIARHCLDCHGSATRRGGIALDGVAADASGPDTWARVADTLRLGTMPPAGRPRPSPAELARVADWIEAEAAECSATEPDPGRVTMRRLNRAEYDRTIRELLGVELDLHLASGFPADDVGYGFDNNGDVLSTPPILIEKYLDAAGRALEAASGSPRAWARIMDPPADRIPPGLRKPTFAARSEPVKRIGRPAALPPPTAAEREEITTARRAEAILRDFADRAFRRPATADELARLVGLFAAARQDGDGFEPAIRHALKAILIAPGFLFHVEETGDPGRSGAKGPVGEFELASRLSYFLWAGPPDAELYGLAARGELRRDDNAARQARRMLGDPRAEALIEGFVFQWLGLRALGELTPDPARFPRFDEGLRRSMLGETARFARAVFLEGGSVYDFLEADWTFIDGRMADHYAIPGVLGGEFRRVSLAGTGRTGVWTQASVLALTSNPTRTSPAKRGKWILDNLLGMPPPPPPEGVAAIDAAAEGSGGRSIRPALERHRADPNCASCHARMDPLGFGLERFDAVGARRSSEGGEAIDDRGTWPGGEAFEGPAGLRGVLVARRGLFARCLAEKLLCYALGRGIGRADRCFVDAIVARLDADPAGRFETLVAAIVGTPAFRERSDPISKGAP